MRNMVEITKVGGEVRIAPMPIGGLKEGGPAQKLIAWMKSDEFPYHVDVSLINCPNQYQGGSSPEDQILVIKRLPLYTRKSFIRKVKLNRYRTSNGTYGAFYKRK